MNPSRTVPGLAVTCLLFLAPTAASAQVNRPWIAIHCNDSDPLCVRAR
jgi:hypothetical protein